APPNFWERCSAMSILARTRGKVYSQVPIGATWGWKPPVSKANSYRLIFQVTTVINHKGGQAMHPTFWYGKRVLITGHTGFKGSWLSLWLQSVGANVVGYALAPPTDPNMFTLASVADGMTSILGD